LPGWIWGRTRRRRPHSVSSPYPGKSPLPAFRPAARPPSGTTYSRPRKKPPADRCRCPHRRGQCNCRPQSNSTPGVSGWPPVSSAPVSCGKENRLACVPAAASLYRGLSLMRFLHFAFRCRSSRKGFLPRRRKLRIARFAASGKTHSLRCSSSPHKAMRLCGGPDNSGVFRRWHAPRNFGTFSPEVRLLAVLPQPGYSFSDGHSVFKVLFIDELSQVYTFLNPCAVYPKGRKSA